VPEYDAGDLVAERVPLCDGETVAETDGVPEDDGVPEYDAGDCVAECDPLSDGEAVADSNGVPEINAGDIVALVTASVEAAVLE
jgi:hypothetical protein